MKTSEIANRLTELCRTGKWDQAQNELYADHAVSIEPKGAPWHIAEGLEAIKKKGDQWGANVEEVHGFEMSDPIIGGDFFSVSMKNDTTFKGLGRITFEEICVYQVADGKIVEERFFYVPMAPPE